MKNKAILYALTVAVLDVIAAAIVINANYKPEIEADEYQIAIDAAMEFESQNLCVKAIEQYVKAYSYRKSPDIILKVADLYTLGYENGEFTSLSGRYDTLSQATDLYPEITEPFDELIEYYYNSGNYSTCGTFIKKALENNISTDTVKKYYEIVRKMYSETSVPYDKVYSVGSCVVTERNVVEYITGEADDEPKEHELVEYTFFNNDGSKSETFSVLNMSPPISVGNSTMYFMKNYGNDAVLEEKSDEIYSWFVMNGVRQCYIGESNEYISVNPSSNSVIILYNTKSGKYDFFSPSGKKIGENFEYAGCFNDSLLYCIKDGVKKVMNASGENVFSKGIEDVVLSFGGRCCSAKRLFVKFSGSNKYRIINSTDFSEINFECDNADLFFDSYAAFEQNGKWGFVDTEGNVAIEPQYDCAQSFANGYAAVKKQGKWGFINKKNEMIVNPMFDEAVYMDSTGMAFVKDSEKGWEKIKLFYMEK